MPANMPPEPTPEDVQTVQTAQQLWNQNNQAQALETIRVAADHGDRWAINLMCWLTMQMGYPTIEGGLPYAKRALALGMPWTVTNFVNNLMGNVPAAPHLVDAALDLLSSLAPWQSGGLDTAGQGWNLVAQGHPAQGIKLMGVSSPSPQTNKQWTEMVEAANQHVIELDQIVLAARDKREEVNLAAANGVVAIQKSRDDLETSAQQAGLLVTSVTADATRSLFDEDAKRNEDESKSAWMWGLIVLGAAAVVAVLPLFLHYIGKGPDYSKGALIGAHAASTAALATVAGVVLARARSRDLARQRANDLSTAMGTMIAYSNRIRDDGEKERFLMTMGQLVLQAHLTAGGSGGAGRDESLSGLVALANVLRVPNAPTRTRKLATELEQDSP